MSDCEQLLPPVHVIHARLTRNQRERRLLRTLLRLVMTEAESTRQTASQPRHEAAGKGVDHA
jgi:hypothetical protein